MNHRPGAAVLAGLLVASIAAIPATARPRVVATGPALRVDTSADQHAISPDIYGMNFPEDALAGELHLPVDRWGGNSASRYNWQSKTTNRANDYFFENTPSGGGFPGEMNLDDTIARDRAIGAKSLITMPLLGYVADPKKTGACGFSVAKYGAQGSADRDCGNGQTAGDQQLTGNDPLDTSIAIGPSYVTDEVKHMVATYGSADAGGVRFYSLDNEPSIWDSTHRDVHPEKPTYDELAQRGIAYGKAIKAGDPSAQVFGPVDWGFIAYLDSEADIRANDHHDKDAHGDEDFVPWYLDQMKAYEDQRGTRLLDYLDEHYYPAADRLALAPAGDDAKQQERLDATRALWDPTYLDQSYIGNDMHEKIDLIPRLKGYVAKHYPGTKVAITEYNFGGLESINGAITQADALGIFGREGLDLATMWSPPGQSDPGANAFRAFMNYDGRGGRFGETSVKASSADQGKLSIYAATRGDDGALTIVVVNKTKRDLRSPIGVAGGPDASTADTWTYSAANIQRIVPSGSRAVHGGRVDTMFPAQSISVVVLPGRGRATTGTGAAASTSSSSVNSGLAALAIVLLLGAGAGLIVPAARRRIPMAMVIAALVAAAAAGGASIVFTTSNGTTANAPATRSTANRVAITSIKDGGTIRPGDAIEGVAHLERGQQLFLEVFAAGPNQYYDIAADDPVKVNGDGTFSVKHHLEGDGTDSYTLVAFVLPDAQAKSYIASDKGQSTYRLPPGSVAQARVNVRLGT